MQNIKYILFVLSIAFMACEQQVIEKQTVNYDYGYFYLDSSFYKEYAVTAISIDAPSEVFDTAHYYIRENYSDWLTDAAGDTIIRIERLFRDSSYQKWQSFNVWTAKIKENKAIQTEDNIIFVKMIFPLSKSLTWDGNAMNRNDTLKQYLYEVISIDSTEMLGEFSFDSVLTVRNRFEESLVMKRDDYEKYAYGLGMVYRQTIDLESQNIDPEIPIEERLTRGTSMFMQIIDYGYE